MHDSTVEDPPMRGIYTTSAQVRLQWHLSPILIIPLNPYEEICFDVAIEKTEKKEKKGERMELELLTPFIYSAPTDQAEFQLFISHCGGRRQYYTLEGSSPSLSQLKVTMTVIELGSVGL
jgi:hypothetical protein